MATVQPFNTGMIETCFKQRGIKYLVDSESNLMIHWGYDEATGCSMNLHFSAQGSKKHIYAITVIAEKPVPKSEWGRAMMICNTWNKDKRFGKAYLYVNDPANDATGMIVFDNHMDLEEGIHQELLNDLTFTIMAAANDFWEWAHKEQGL
jgi:hypothetical protein